MASACSQSDQQSITYLSESSDDFTQDDSLHITYSTETSGDVKKDDFRRLNSCKEFTKRYKVVKATTSPQTPISNDLTLLFFSDNIFQANHTITKLNAYFRDTMHFELTPRKGDNPLTYVLTLFFKTNYGCAGIQFRHRKTIPKCFPPVALPYCRGSCPANSAIQFMCFYFAHGSQIQELKSFIPLFQAKHLAKVAMYKACIKSGRNKTITESSFNAEAAAAITEISEKIVKTKLARLQYMGFTSPFKYKKTSYDLTISKDEFSDYSTLISSLETLCEKLTLSISKGDANARAEYYQFVTTPRHEWRGFLFLRPLPVRDWIYASLHKQKRRVPPLLIQVYLCL